MVNEKTCSNCTKSVLTVKGYFCAVKKEPVKSYQKVCECFIKMVQRISYIVGAFGSGKTTAVDYLAQEYTPNIIPVLEDEDLVWFLKQPNILNMELSYLNISYYKIKRAITKSEQGSRDIVVDGHPLQALIYARAFFELEHGQTLSFPEWGILNKAHTRLYDYVINKAKLFKNWHQTIFYLNIPYEENWKNIVGRGRTEMNEMDEWYLENVRRILHQEIYSLADYYKCELIEVSSLQEIIDSKIFK
jgi:deoxyadenosine/deoxycytidine kinase